MKLKQSFTYLSQIFTKKRQLDESRQLELDVDTIMQDLEHESTNSIFVNEGNGNLACDYQIDIASTGVHD